MRCDRCGKGVLVGMNVSHSHIRTKKRSYPNLHAFKIKAGGVTRRLRLCTKCLRIVKKEAAVSVKTQKTATTATTEKVENTEEQTATTDVQKEIESTELANAEVKESAA